jgi:hypothetical protein
LSYPPGFAMPTRVRSAGLMPMRDRTLTSRLKSPLLIWAPCFRKRSIRTAAISTSTRSPRVSTPGGQMAASSCHTTACSAVKYSGGSPSGPAAGGSVRLRCGFFRNAPVSSSTAVGLRGLPMFQSIENRRKTHSALRMRISLDCSVAKGVVESAHHGSSCFPRFSAFSLPFVCNLFFWGRKNLAGERSPNGKCSRILLTPPPVMSCCYCWMCLAPSSGVCSGLFWAPAGEEPPIVCCTVTTDYSV